MLILPCVSKRQRFSKLSGRAKKQRILRTDDQNTRSGLLARSGLLSRLNCEREAHPGLAFTWTSGQLDERPSCEPEGGSIRLRSVADAVRCIMRDRLLLRRREKPVYCRASTRYALGCSLTLEDGRGRCGLSGVVKRMKCGGGCRQLGKGGENRIY